MIVYKMIVFFLLAFPSLLVMLENINPKAKDVFHLDYFAVACVIAVVAIIDFIVETIREYKTAIKRG